MKNKEEALLKSQVKAELVKDIELWLIRSGEKTQEKEGYPIGSWQRENSRDESHKYFSMAQALFLVSQNLGLLTYEEYPMFKTFDYMEKEAK